MVTSKSLIRLCLVTSILGTSTIAQDPPKPTAEHEILAADEGTWDATITSFLGGPDGEPTVSKGTEVNTLLAGGLWLVSEFEGDIGGVKFVGRGHFGYDPLRKKIRRHMDRLHEPAPIGAGGSVRREDEDDDLRG